MLQAEILKETYIASAGIYCSPNIMPITVLKG
jgi:hypothetical protein